MSTRRLNARVRPSGANAGVTSPTDGANGVVSFRLSPVSIETKYNANRPVGESLSLKASELPSGDQANFAFGNPAVSVISRSGPPRAGIRNNAHLSSEIHRRNAMKRPSGDQAGLLPPAGYLVNRRGGPTVPI